MGKPTREKPQETTVRSKGGVRILAPRLLVKSKEQAVAAGRPAQKRKTSRKEELRKLFNWAWWELQKEGKPSHRSGIHDPTAHDGIGLTE